MKLGEVCSSTHGYYNFIKFHQNLVKSKQVLNTKHLTDSPSNREQVEFGHTIQIASFLSMHSGQKYIQNTEHQNTYPQKITRKLNLQPLKLGF